LTRTPTLTATSTPTNTNTPTETGTPSNTPTPSVTNTPVIGSVNGNGINARDCPSLECSSITTLNTIDEIVILGEYGEWYWVALPNGGSAYVFGNLISLPDGAEIAVAPTLTPSSTSSNTPLPTSTPRPTQTQRPTETAIVFDEETLLLLVELALITNDLQVLDIRIQSGTLTVDMPNSHIFYTNEEYLGASLGGVSGAVVGVYREETSARSPTTIRINYKQSGSTLVSATFSYRDAVAMIDHNITEEEFLFERVTFR
jgi:hypothetical protein